MRQYFTTAFLIVMLLLTMAGCSAADAGQKLDAAEDRVENRLDALEDSLERAVPKSFPPVSAAVPTDAVSDPITKEGAEKIALDSLGLAKDQVKGLRTEYEIDDGTGQYDVQFLSGGWKYEFEIHAETGRILSFDKDREYD